MNQYVEAARVTTAVPFNGPADASLLSRHGTLVWDVANEVLICSPDSKPGRVLIVPMDNVAFLELMSEARTEAYLKERADRAAARAPKPKPPPAAPPVVIDDRIVYAKDPITGQITESKASAPPKDIDAEIEKASAAEDLE